MKSIISFIKRNFELSQSEAKSVLFGIAALFLFVLMSIAFDRITDKRDRQFSLSAYNQPEKELTELNRKKKELIPERRTKTESIELKPFNPNQISIEKLIKMGFPKYGAANLVKFRKAGKVYRFKEDLASVYGISEELFSEIEPFIDLPSKADRQAASTFETISEGYPEKVEKPVRTSPKSIVKFDINLAKAEELTQVYGIGKVFADRIIKYRESLGGFHDINQVKSTNGLPDSTYAELLKHVYLEAEPIKIKINEIELSDWTSRHLSYSKKKGILAYRKQHGPFTSAEELEKLHILSKEDIAAVSPYLDFSIAND